MTNKVLKSRLAKMNACTEAVEWLGDRDLETAWKECPRGDWMLWLACRIEVDQKLLVKAACECAELALPLYEKKYPKDNRVRNCIAVTLKWVAGKATLDDVRNAADAAAHEEMQKQCAAKVRRAIPFAEVEKVIRKH